jgi:hypothetical protein
MPGLMARRTGPTFPLPTLERGECPIFRLTYNNSSATLAGNSCHRGHTVKKLPDIATMLLLMGLFMVPACDEGKGTDPLALAALYNSKYYLEFDADYDNDGSVDEHVEMRVSEPFRYNQVEPSIYRYSASFRNRNDYVDIDLPGDTNNPTPIIYNEDKNNFIVVFVKDHVIYDSSETAETSDTFQLSITEWGGNGGVVVANFNGYLYDFLHIEKIIITNGLLTTRIKI